MNLKEVKNELQNIISGKIVQSQSNTIQAAKDYLISSSQPSSQFESTEPDRTKEERALKEYAAKNSLLVNRSSLGNYITEGAEQKVYYKEGNNHLFKVADAIFYTTWIDYLNNLLLHNYFFPDTAYTIIGFIEEDDKFYTVVQQNFVHQTETTNLNAVKNLLLTNGFLHKKNNDYYHPYLGIILEDLHDENVLTNNEVLFFIDTVFYLTPDFCE